MARRILLGKKITARLGPHSQHAEKGGSDRNRTRLVVKGWGLEVVLRYTSLLQPGILRKSQAEERHILIGAFPEGEKILVGLPALLLLAGGCQRAGKP